MLTVKGVLGSRNDFTPMLDLFLEEGDTNLLDISLNLDGTLFSPIAYASPKALTVALFESMGSPSVQ